MKIILHTDPSPQVGASFALTLFEYPVPSISQSHPLSDTATLPSAPNLTVGSLKACKPGEQFSLLFLRESGGVLQVYEAEFLWPGLMQTLTCILWFSFAAAVASSVLLGIRKMSLLLLWSL